jgi:hypothetical protein
MDKYIQAKNTYILRKKKVLFKILVMVVSISTLLRPHNLYYYTNF